MYLDDVNFQRQTLFFYSEDNSLVKVKTTPW